MPANSKIIMNDPSPPPRASRHPRSKPRRRKQKHNLILLPTEILLQITSHLSKSAWLSLRLVSRTFYALSSDFPLITQLWFSPYLEDRTAFTTLCNHPFLGHCVTTVIYDITRFEEFSFEELRELWPRPWRRHRENGYRRQSRKEWLENHPGPWQYLKVVEEAKSSGFDEGRALMEGLKTLPTVKTVRLAFAFQKRWLVTHEDFMSPLRMYSDVEWVSRQEEPLRAQIDGEQMGRLLDAIIQSGTNIEELDLWQDYISVPLNVFNFGERFEQLSVIFSRLTRLTIRVSWSSMENMLDVLASGSCWLVRKS